MCPAAEKIIFFIPFLFLELCRLDFADVVLYFNQMEWIAAHKPVSAFDPNGEGRIDFADIMALVNEI